MNTVTVGSESSKIFVGQNNCSDGGTPQTEKFWPSGNLCLEVRKRLEQTNSIFSFSSGTAQINHIGRNIMKFHFFHDYHRNTRHGARKSYKSNKRE